MKEYIEKLLCGQDLDDGEMTGAFECIMSGETSAARIAAFLVALRAKGASAAEIARAAAVMRARALTVELEDEVVDTCGTGGDQAATFNISTAVAFVLAGAGLKVAKHGNRSVSSSSGSADCLEALGVPIDLGPPQAAEAIRQNGFAFLFAPHYHPSMRHAAPARQELGIKTIFNILGPLCNPAGAAYQVVGVYAHELVRPMIEVLALLGVKGAVVVHAGSAVHAAGPGAGLKAGGLDEVSIDGVTSYARLAAGRITAGEITPRAAGIQPGPLEALRVSSREESARLIEGVFKGEICGPCRESIVINAAAAFMAVDDGLDVRDGVALARGVIGRGEAYNALQRARA